MIDGLAVQHRSRAARVVRDHAADGRAARGGDVGREAQAVRLQLRVQLVEHDARLDARPALGDVHLEDAVEVLRGVDDEAGADRLAGLRRAAAARRDRDAVAAGDLDRPDDVLARARDDDAERLDLIDAGVGGIERARDGIESDFAFDRALKVEPESVGHPARNISTGSGRYCLSYTCTLSTLPPAAFVPLAAVVSVFPLAGRAVGRSLDGDSFVVRRSGDGSVHVTLKPLPAVAITTVELLGAVPALYLPLARLSFQVPTPPLRKGWTMIRTGSGDATTTDFEGNGRTDDLGRGNPATSMTGAAAVRCSSRMLVRCGASASASSCWYWSARRAPRRPSRSRLSRHYPARGDRYGSGPRPRPRGSHPKRASAVERRRRRRRSLTRSRVNRSATAVALQSAQR